MISVGKKIGEECGDLFRQNKSFEDMIDAQAEEVYRDTCVQMVEMNGLRPKALEIFQGVCDAHIANQRKRDPLLSSHKEWAAIKKRGLE